MSGELNMKQFIKRLFGFKDPEPVVVKEEVVKLSPKEIATANKEPWVQVLDTHVNKDNIRNGFFELDWNEYFVLQLKEAGYKGDSEESIVDAWFGELCRNVGNESGVNMNQRTAGYINVNNLGDGRTEVS
jgi:hypothetical protein